MRFFLDSFFAMLGAIVLFIKHKKREQVSEVLERDFHGSHTEAGYAIVWRLLRPILLWLAVIGLVLVWVFMIVIIFRRK